MMRRIDLIQQWKSRWISGVGARLDADDEGRWITTENGHHVHINGEGEPDKGNPHVVSAMKGGGKGGSASKLGGSVDKSSDSKSGGVKHSKSLGTDLKNKRDVKGYVEKMECGDTMKVIDPYGRDCVFVRLPTEKIGAPPVWGMIDPKSGELVDDTFSRGSISGRYSVYSPSEIAGGIISAKSSKSKRAIEKGAATQTLNIKGTYSDKEAWSLINHATTHGQMPMKKKYKDD